jgi:hypothetical protein
MRMNADQLLEFVRRGMLARDAVDAVVAGTKTRAHPEDDIQRAACEFWALCYPQTWAMTFHPPNGLAAKNRKLAAIFKGLGVKPGVFDLLCIARRGSFNGFALELKAQRGVVSAAQNEWRERFIAQGWHTEIAHSLDKALIAIRQYNDLPPPRGSP